MDFTLFLNSSSSLLLLRLSSWDCFKVRVCRKILSLSVGSMKFLIKYEFIIYFLCCCCFCLLLRWATKTDRKQNRRKISFNSHLHQRKLSQSVKWTFESRRWIAAECLEDVSMTKQISVGQQRQGTKIYVNDLNYSMKLLINNLSLTFLVASFKIHYDYDELPVESHINKNKFS